jgi:2-polyprenyl-3-methyl-5-hydroxy-6-metoxy-1,4-benzoquinol methylase
VDPIPNNLDKIYGENYFHATGAQEFGYSDYDRDKEPMRHIFEQYLDTFEQFSKNKSVIDIGCATGYFLDIAKKRGWKTHGVEISEFAAQEAASRGHDIFVSQLPELNIGDRVDIVTMWDVLEHVDDPRAYLQAAHRLLNDGGYVAINTVDISSLWASLMGKRWHLIVPPEHIHYYNPTNLKELLKQTGFETLNICKIEKKFSLPYFFMMGYRWQGLFLWKFCAEFFNKPFWKKMSIPINFHDNIFLLAKKVEL